MFDWDEVPEQLGGPNKAALQVQAEAGAPANRESLGLRGHARLSAKANPASRSQRLQPSVRSGDAASGQKAPPLQALQGILHVVGNRSAMTGLICCRTCSGQARSCKAAWQQAGACKTGNFPKLVVAGPFILLENPRLQPRETS